VNPTRRKWIVPGALVGAAIVVAASAVMLGVRHTPTHAVAEPVATTSAPSSAVAALPAPAVPLPPLTAIMDSSAGAVGRRFDSTKALAAQAVRKPKKVLRDSTARAGLDSSPKVARDSGRGRKPMTLGDSLFNFRDPVPLRRDSVVKRDSARPDSTPP
jgi:hypothetical protein